MAFSAPILVYVPLLTVSFSEGTLIHWPSGFPGGQPEWRPCLLFWYIPSNFPASFDFFRTSRSSPSTDLSLTKCGSTDHSSLFSEFLLRGGTRYLKSSHPEPPPRTPFFLFFSATIFPCSCRETSFYGCTSWVGGVFSAPPHR